VLVGGAPRPELQCSNLECLANNKSQPAGELFGQWSRLATVFFVLVEVFAVALLTVFTVFTARIRFTLCNKFAYVINRLPVEY